MDQKSRIYVAGHTGLLGSAVVRKLKQDGYGNLIYRTISELDLTKQEDTYNFLQESSPEYVFLCAAKVGGIQANLDSPADFLYTNLQIQNNVINGSYKAGVKNLLFVGSSCIYPRETQYPISEEALLQGPLEPTNEGYAIAKIAGLKMCEYYNKQFGVNYISAMPTNLYGINDLYHERDSHLLPSLIMKIHRAKKDNDKQILLWGTGRPRREFMLSDDCADALIFLMKNYRGMRHVNVGTGIDHSISELANIVAKVIGFNVNISFDSTKPDGMLRKDLDVTLINKLGWKARYKLEDGIKIAYSDYLTRWEKN